MKIIFFLLFFLNKYAVSLILNSPVKNKGILLKEAESDIKCFTADGDEGLCRSFNDCKTSSSQSERLINCGSVLDGKINHICCPTKTYFNQTLQLKNHGSCGKHPDFLTIVGGQEVKPHFYPWVVAIYQIIPLPATSTNNYTAFIYRFICGGTLISNQHVLSAGHCVVHGYKTFTARDFVIKVGAHNLDNSGKFYRVSQVWAHENYRSYQRYNDISLFKLMTEVKNDILYSACLPINQPDYNFKNVFQDGTPLTVAGWGTTKFLGRLSENLKAANVFFINNLQCSKNYTSLQGSDMAYPNGIDQTMICAGKWEGGVDSCQGDSGGPLMYTRADTNKVYLVGIVSFGYKCAAPGYPGIYTKVSTYLNWIHNKMLL